MPRATRACAIMEAPGAILGSAGRDGDMGCALDKAGVCMVSLHATEASFGAHAGEGGASLGTSLRPANGRKEQGAGNQGGVPERCRWTLLNPSPYHWGLCLGASIRNCSRSRAGTQRKSTTQGDQRHVCGCHMHRQGCTATRGMG